MKYAIIYKNEIIHITENLNSNDSLAILENYKKTFDFNDIIVRTKIIKNKDTLPCKIHDLCCNIIEYFTFNEYKLKNKHFNILPITTFNLKKQLENFKTITNEYEQQSNI